MLKLSIFCCILCFTLKASAQTPERKAMALLHKITATWCTPCGTWGWTLAEQLREQTSDKAIYIGLFASGSTADRNDEFYNQTAATLAHAFTFSGYPSFGVNGLPYSQPSATSGIDAELVKTDVLRAVDSFSALDPIAGAAGYYSIDGDQVMVRAKIRFWEAAEGSFYLAAYIVEDNAMNIQSGRSFNDSEVPHHDVLRASMTSESAWGIPIDSSQVSGSTDYNVDFSYTLTDSTWDKDNLKVYLILWKKEQELYSFVNAAVAEGDPLAIPEAYPIDTDMQVFPNPANSVVRIPVDPNAHADIHIRIRDISGRTVFSQSVRQPSTQVIEVNVEQFSRGLYILERRQGESRSTDKFSILR